MKTWKLPTLTLILVVVLPLFGADGFWPKKIVTASADDSTITKDSFQGVTDGPDREGHSPPVNTTVADFISSGNHVTSSSDVFLSIGATDRDGDITHYLVSESGEAPTPGEEDWKPLPESVNYTQRVPFLLSPGNGEKTVFVWFKDSRGNISGHKSDSIQKYVFNKLPDTGQNRRYTGSFFFGEDADYTINPMNYTDNRDGTVIDNQTGLLWQNPIGSSPRTWDEAVEYCDNLVFGEKNFINWRLPTVQELLSIVDYGQNSPSVNKKYFPGTISDFYWTSTHYTAFTKMAWYVDFKFGTVGYYRLKTNRYYARCVRNAP